MRGKGREKEIRREGREKKEGETERDNGEKRAR